MREGRLPTSLDGDLEGTDAAVAFFGENLEAAGRPIEHPAGAIEIFKACFADGAVTVPALRARLISSARRRSSGVKEEDMVKLYAHPTRHAGV